MPDSWWVVADARKLLVQSLSTFLDKPFYASDEGLVGKSLLEAQQHLLGGITQPAPEVNEPRQMTAKLTALPFVLS